MLRRAGLAVPRTRSNDVMVLPSPDAGCQERHASWLQPRSLCSRCRDRSWQVPPWLNAGTRRPSLASYNASTIGEVSIAVDRAPGMPRLPLIGAGGQPASSVRDHRGWRGSHHPSIWRPQRRGSRAVTSRKSGLLHGPRRMLRPSLSSAYYFASHGNGCGSIPRPVMPQECLADGPAFPGGHTDEIRLSRFSILPALPA